MLEKEDLDQIGQLLDAWIKKGLAPIEERLRHVVFKLERMGNDITRIDNKIDGLVIAINEEQENLKERIERIEKHLNLPSYF